MKHKAFKRVLIILLVVAIFVTGMPMNSVYAEENGLTNRVLTEVQDALGEMGEAMADSKSVVSAGDWRTAIYYDYLPWNFFHN